MNVAGIMLLGAAAVPLVCGLEASGVVPSDCTRIFRGGPADRVVWLFGGSAAAGMMGLALVITSRTRLT